MGKRVIEGTVPRMVRWAKAHEAGQTITATARAFADAAGLGLVRMMTQAEFDALPTPDPDDHEPVLYLIEDGGGDGQSD